MCENQYLIHKSKTTFLELLIFFQEQYWIPYPYDNNNLLPIILLYLLRKIHK